MSTPVKLIIAALGLVFVVVGVGLILPSQLIVEREIRVRAPLELTFAQFNDLSQYRLWALGLGADQLEVECGAQTVGVGAWCRWSQAQGRPMTLRITRSKAHSALEIQHLDASGPAGAPSSAFTRIRLAQAHGEVRVTWSFHRDHGWDLPARYRGLAMEAMIGPELELGFARLRERLHTLRAAAGSSGVTPQLDNQRPGPHSP